MGGGGLVIGVVLLNLYGHLYKSERCVEGLFLVLSAAIPMIIVEWLFQPANAIEQPLVWSALLTGALVRTIGIGTTVATMLGIYWTLPIYHFGLMTGVFDIDDRPLNDFELKRIKDGGEARSPDNKPLYHNFFRLGGVVLFNCGGFVTSWDLRVLTPFDR